MLFKQFLAYGFERLFNSYDTFVANRIWDVSPPNNNFFFGLFLCLLLAVSGNPASVPLKDPTYGHPICTLYFAYRVKGVPLLVPIGSLISSEGAAAGNQLSCNYAIP